MPIYNYRESGAGDNGVASKNFNHRTGVAEDNGAAMKSSSSIPEFANAIRILFRFASRGLFVSPVVRCLRFPELSLLWRLMRRG